MGHFFFSFFKELNSATNKNMIALAFVLGLISGFLPTFTAINYLIFLFVLIFRVPLGLYTASFAFFALISYIFDPIFNKIGYLILSASFLKPIWTFLYNVPFMRWSGFNNTLVMGSLVSGIILGIIFFILIVKSIDRYRKTIFPKIKEIKFLSWIVPSEEKKGIIRISGIVAAGVVIGFVSFILIVFLDPFLKLILAFSLSKTLHKKVYIESLQTKLSSPSLQIKNMQIDNFLITQAYVKFNMENLLWRKYDIEKMTLSAKTNSSILDYIKKTNSKSNATSFKLPKIKLPSAKEVLQKQTLKSEIAIKKLQKDYQAFMKYYKSLNIKKYQSQIKEIENQIKMLSKTKINSPQDILKLKKEIANIQNQIKNLQNETKSQIKELKNYKNLLLDDIKNVKTAMKEDYKNISNQFNLVKSGNFVKLSEIYFKPEISKYITLADKVFEKIKPYLHKEKKEKIVIPRRGIYIKYPDKIKVPDFVLRDGKISLKTSVAKYQGILKDISDNQKLLNKPAVVRITGNSKFYNVLFNASYFDFVKFSGYANNIKLKKLIFKDLEILHPVINTTFKGDYKEKLNLSAIIDFLKTKVVLNKNDKFSKIINQVLAKLENFKVFVKVSGKDIEVSSDLDKIVSNAFMKVYKEKIEKEKQRALNMLNKKINTELQKYKIKGIDADIKSLNDMKGYLNKLIKKAQEVLIKKEKNKIKNQILNKIKLF
ncbi:TIGR03545 family protein [Caminibacter sp.]